MAEVRFYQLGQRRLEDVLPVMLERTMARKQRAIVRAASQERIDALDVHLWTYSERAFLPHGTDKDGFSARQPVWLTLKDERPNQAEVLFLIEGAEAQDLSPFELVAVLFDGGEADRLQAARAQWKALQGGSHLLSYWEEDAGGQWIKRA